ncbi:MAG: peptidase M3, partial [Paludibacteraceae bacterium]|nr:peptidase M3 [Paludibacteraceae bacterium]
MKKLLILSAMMITLIACNKNDNPLLVEQNTPYGVPAFDKIKLEHYKPAFDAAIQAYRDEVAAITDNEEAPTFQNTIAALDRSGSLLARVEGVFFNLLETDGNDEMNALAEEVMPLLSECTDETLLNEKLFARVKAVYDQRESLDLTPEQLRLTEECYKCYVLNGANLEQAAKERLKEINRELGLLSLKFGQNVVAETNAVQHFVTDEAEL